MILKRKKIMATTAQYMRLTDAEAAALLNAAPDAIVVVDTAGTIVLVNTQAETLLGYARGELHGRDVEELLPHRFRAAHVTRRALYEGDPQARPMGTGLDLFALHKDGTEIPVEISLSPLETGSGLLISSAIRDVTERRAAEAVLIETRKEADRANRAKSAFLAAASHDLRQPLQTLSLLNTVLARTSHPQSKAAEVAAIQEEAIDSMSKLLNSLLDISKLEAGAVKPDVHDCSVRHILESIRMQFSAHAEAKGLVLYLDASDDVVRTDPTLLQQILQNFVANAIRYTQQGHVRLSCPDNGSAVRIEVLDTGLGIPPEERDLIFEDFYQVPAVDGMRREGLGLGLSIVRRLADLLNLTIDVRSTPGQGSCFAVDVPKGDRQATRPTANGHPESAPADTAGAVILIVDDDEAVAQATALLLEVIGYKPVVAPSLREARALLGNEDLIPDLIVADFHLAEGESGIEVIRALRETASRAIPAVLVTGDTSRDVSEALAGIDDCRLLSKPVDGADLTALIQSLI
jgi:two-component system, sensor histidine kinase